MSLTDDNLNLLSVTYIPFEATSTAAILASSHVMAAILLCAFQPVLYFNAGVHIDTSACHLQLHTLARVDQPKHKLTQL